MITKTEAWRDSTGRLHATREAAVRAEFEKQIIDAAAWMPTLVRNCPGGSVGGALAFDILNHHTARKKLMEALLFLEQHGDQP